MNYADYQIGDEPPTLLERVRDTLHRAGYGPRDAVYTTIVGALDDADVGPGHVSYGAVLDACNSDDVTELYVIADGVLS